MMKTQAAAWLNKDALLCLNSSACSAQSLRLNNFMTKWLRGEVKDYDFQKSLADRAKRNHLELAQSIVGAGQAADLRLPQTRGHVGCADERRTAAAIRPMDYLDNCLHGLPAKGA